VTTEDRARISAGTRQPPEGKVMTATRSLTASWFFSFLRLRVFFGAAQIIWYATNQPWLSGQRTSVHTFTIGALVPITRSAQFEQSYPTRDYNFV